jgi:hypothetical protein
MVMNMPAAVSTPSCWTTLSDDSATTRNPAAVVVELATLAQPRLPTVSATAARASVGWRWRAWIRRP